MNKFEYIIFDLDGTLLDTLEDLADSVNYALRCCNYPERTISEVRDFIGNGVETLIKRSVPKEANEAQVKSCLQCFKNHYTDNLNNRTKPYDGIIRMMQELKNNGYKMAIVSNKFESAVKLLSDKYFGNLIITAVGDLPGFKKKPSPDNVLRAIEQLGASKEKSVYIGDSEVDIDTAINSGLDYIIVSWGNRTKEYLMQFDVKNIAETPEALINILKDKVAMHYGKGKEN